ncbi:MAG TPA: T9SS type A sorting domain-containing protein, partial [Bacteroidia bacterium]
YKNNGADDAPVFAYQQNDFLQEGEIEVGAGAYPRFFDIDADGLMDLVIGNHQTIVGPCPNASQFSSLTAYRNVGTATDPQFKFVTNDYGGLMSSLPNILNFAPTFGDIDADGDQDMIVGDANGYLHLFLNTAGAGNPAVFALQNPVNMRDDNNDSIHIPTNYAMPVLFDMDQDNLPDLVIGGRNGNLTYYHNTGTANSPLFTFVTSTLGNVDVWTTCCTGYATPYIFLDSGNIEMYIGSEQGYIYHYTNITGNLSGTFNKADSLLAGANEVWEGLRSAPCVMDVTGDGLPDLVTGNYRGGLAFYKGDMTVGMNSTEVSAEANVSLYPNPAGQTLFYKMSNMDQDVLVEMYDALGKRVLTKRTNVLSGSLDVSALGNGVYTCKFISARTQCVKKVVIDK